MEQVDNNMDEKDKKDENTKPEEQKNKENKGSKKSVIILAILLLLSWAGIGLLYVDSSKKIADCTDNFNSVSSERDQLISSLDSLENEYITLRENSDSVNTELEQKIAEVQKLKKQVWAAKNASKAEIEALRKEVGTLQEVGKLYVAKIDSLDRMNKQLIDSNNQLMADIEEAQKVDMEKTKQLEELAVKVEMASVLKATNVISIPLSKKSKPNFKAKKVEKIKTSARLLENSVIEAGEKTIFVRIIRNDGVILASSTDNVFKYDGEEVLYSEKREVTYNNQDIEFDIYYEANDDIISGTYKVLLFCEGKEIGNTSFILK